jgi:hypothetical protein
MYVCMYFNDSRTQQVVYYKNMVPLSQLQKITIKLLKGKGQAQNFYLSLDLKIASDGADCKS